MIGLLAITRKDFIDFAIMPGIRTRLTDLFVSGFHYIPFFIALVYQAVRLLPDNHPYANPANLGKFGIRHVIAEAANNIVIDRNNIDQLLLFVMTLIGLAIVVVQIAVLAFSLFMQPVMAQNYSAFMPTNFHGFFGTPDPAQDIAFIFMDMVFGVRDIFNSCVALPDVPCLDMAGEAIIRQDYFGHGEWILESLRWPYPVHDGLHNMFRMYSIGLLVVATFITCYFIITIIAETAQTGTAFGKRFNKVWAPLRLVFAFGLLIPVGSGLNSSQYIVLYAAKLGSGFASNGWNIFNEALLYWNSGPGQGRLVANRLVSTPNSPEIGGLLQFVYVARTCAELEALRLQPREINPYFVKDPLAAPNHYQLDFSSYQEMIDFADGETQVTLVFGPEPDAKSYPKEPGYIEPTCGKMSFSLTDPRDPESTDNPPEEGARIMQAYYLFVIQELWFRVYQGEIDADFMPSLVDYQDQNFPENLAQKYTTWGNGDPDLPEPPPQFKRDVQEFYSRDLVNAMLDPDESGLTDVIESDIGAIIAQELNGKWEVDDVIRRKGWAGAGIWYNKVAEQNGAVTSAVLNIPTIVTYADVQEQVLALKKQEDQHIAVNRRFEPKTSAATALKLKTPAQNQMAQVLWTAFKYWQIDGHTTTTHTAPQGNPFIDAINALLGTEGLYSMRKNQDVHPLAQLVGVGRSLIESGVRNLLGAGAAAVGGAIWSSFDKSTGKIVDVGIGFAMTITSISMTLGFILFYVVPFLPFIYFFFAVGGWVKGIFEAMVGAPLWALAHIRIDANGLPGKAAVNGYFLIFEIFIRPILIVFGLLASISILAALVSVLNDVWELVSANIGGFDMKAELSGEGEDGIDFRSLIDFMRGPIDEFFYTVVYTIVVYMMAMSSFKLIDLIPNQILRWMGQSVSTFNDQAEDAAAGITGKAYFGGEQTMSATTGGVGGMLKGIRSTGESAG